MNLNITGGDTCARSKTGFKADGALNLPDAQETVSAHHFLHLDT